MPHTELVSHKEDHKGIKHTTATITTLPVFGIRKPPITMVPPCEWDSYPRALGREEGNLHRILNRTLPAHFFIRRKETTCYQSTAPF